MRTIARLSGVTLSNIYNYFRDKDTLFRAVLQPLLAAFERACAGMDMFLRTDDACTYQFYEHRGFMRAAERDVVMEGAKGAFTLKCMMYVKHVDA